MAPTRMTRTVLEILLSLSGGPLHGYGIKLDVTERTGGEMKLGSGTLYEAIQRLEEAGFIASAEGPDEEGGDERRRYYRLLPEGDRALRAGLLRMDAMMRLARERDLLPGWEEV